MGLHSSKPPPPPFSKSETDSWPPPPTTLPADEQNPNDLIFHAWAFCKAKSKSSKLYRSDAEERTRRSKLSWRKRQSFIELDCGEDSFFVSNHYKAIGVADGVGGWRDEGVDSSLVSNGLMENAKWFTETHRQELNPEVIMEAAYRKLVNDKKVNIGSSTACIATLRTDGGEDHPVHSNDKAATTTTNATNTPPQAILDVANLGDSGLMVIRHQKFLHRVAEKSHGFNTPFQLAIIPNRYRKPIISDRVSDCVREKIPVQKGDVIIMGTDGLFDNQFHAQLIDNAGWIGDLETSPASRIPFIGFLLGAALAPKVEYLDPYRVAQRIVSDAWKVSLNKEAITPWAKMLRHYGVSEAKGGKADDITLVLCRIGTREELGNTVFW